ncbi:MAG: tetratricopeptide repeat protein [Treponema sp.]|nr:tetratricopeptide repeat protein [Candidatus Treponema caballi]
MRCLSKYRKIISAFLVLSSFSVLCAGTGDSEFRAFNDLSYVFHSGFYPAAISRADDFISTYSRSTLVSDALLLKGESLFLLGRYSEAATCLEKPDNHSADASYWLGRSRFALKQYRAAASAFYEAAALSGPEPSDAERYRSILVYAAFSLSNDGDKEQAAALLQYVLSRYEMAEDLVPSAVLLFSLYQSLERYDATIALYNQLEPLVAGLESGLNESVMLSVANAFSMTGNTEKAWQLYSQLDPKYKAEMWLRFGISSFEQGDFESALSYFDSADETASREQKNLSAIYRSEMLLQQDKAAEGLALLEDATFEESAWYTDSLLELARCAAFAGDRWHALTYVQKLEASLSDSAPCADAVFWEMWAASQLDRWNDIRALYDAMPENVVFPEAAALYSRALMVTSPGDASARKAASELEDSGDIRNACVAYLLSGQYDRVLSDTEDAVPGTDESYLRGLALLTKGRWNEAAAALGTDSPWALYYTAYALYRAGDTVNGYRLFTQFTNENPVHKMSYDAHMNAALCALQNGEPKKALAPAEKAGSFAQTEKQRIDAHLQCSLIYNDLNRLTDAIRVLEQDMNSASRNAVSLKFQLADLYAEAGRLTDADALLARTEDLLSGTQLAEETAFRRAELYYSRGLWDQAAARFSACRKNYPEGSAAARALYYNALCCENGGNADSAILMFEACRSADSAGQYTFSCMAHLVPLYRASGEVNTALRLAEQVLAAFPKEAAQAGIQEMTAELRLLSEGADEQTARLLARFNELGVSSVEGRTVGVELARQYLDLYSRQSQGMKLLEDITSAISSDAVFDDMKTGVLAYSLLGRNLRQTDKLEESAAAWLEAARFGASVSEEETARALYCAAEAFDAAGKAGDARLVLSQMTELYPRSQWTARAAALIEGL